MNLIVFRIGMCFLIALQSFSPVLACGCEPYGYEVCECPFDCSNSVYYSPCLDDQFDFCGDCETCEPVADSKQESSKPDTSSKTDESLLQPATAAESETPTPATQTPTSVLPPPVAVPQADDQTDRKSADVFPGPETPAGDSTTKPEPEEKSQIDELFEEPSALTEPQPSPPSEATTPVTNSTETLFVEPKQDTELPPLDNSSEVPESSETEPEAQPEKQEDSFEDLFGPAEEEPSQEPEPKEEPQSAPYDPFSAKELPSTIQNSDIASTETRHWTSRSTQHTFEARLVSLTVEQVVLEKATGVQLSVPISQLSDADLDFVQDHVRSLRRVLTKESVAAQLASSWSR